MRYVESINKALDFFLKNFDDSFIIGEDLDDPYGGAFKATKGLSSKYPDRVISTPISESLIIGMATGLALKNHKVITEIMFGDFITLCVDQIVNHLTKFESMYSLEKSLGVIIRTPMGGYRSYGPTHSQSLESLFFNIPNLNIISPSFLLDPFITYEKTVNSNKISLVIEHKSLYPIEIIKNLDGINLHLIDNFELIEYSQKTSNAELTIISYGNTSLHAFNAINALKKELDIDIKLLIPTKIYPLDSMINSFITTKKVLIVDETLNEFGWSKYLFTKLNKDLLTYMMSTNFTIIPASKKLERTILPTEDRIKNYIIEEII